MLLKVTKIRIGLPERFVKTAPLNTPSFSSRGIPWFAENFLTLSVEINNQYLIVMRYLLLLPLFLIVACSESTDAELTGQWQGSSWLVKGQPSGRDASQVSFDFQADGRYSGSFGNQKEAGSYRLEGNKLYTNAEGQAEKMVEVSLSGTDTLRMDMNRAGTPETIVLVRK